MRQVALLKVKDLRMTNSTITPDLTEFRRDVRAFLLNNLPEVIRKKTAAGVELTESEYRDWMRILSDQGWIAVNWPKQDGGPGWSLWERSAYEE